MTLKDWTSLGVRILGFWLLVQAVIYILFSIPLMHGMPHSVDGLSTDAQTTVLWAGQFLMLAVGVVMLFKAEEITRLVCRAQLGGKSK